MKRQRDSVSVNSQLEKRVKEVDFVEEEIQLRDKLLDEFSLNPSSHNQNSQREVEGSADNENQQLRRIIKLEGRLPNLALPDGWIALNHRSGGIIYLHRATRVCTWARPYYIGKGSVRKHDIPLSAIPCLHQKKALKTKLIQKESNQNLSVDKGSILNFLNTAGSTDNHIKQENVPSGGNCKIDTEYRNDHSGKEGFSTNEDDNTSSEDSSVAIDSQQKVSGSDSGIYGNNEIVHVGGNYGNHRQDDGDGNGKNKIADDSNNGNNDDDNGNFGKNELVCGVDGNCSGNGNAADVNTKSFNVFHPKDGLDVVNDTLRVYSENTHVLNSIHQNSGIDLIDAEDLNAYIGKIFKFEELTIHQEQNVVKTSNPLEKKVDSPLPSALECLPYCVKGKSAKENKSWVLNPGGKTPVAILHEYSQAVLKERPEYVCSECENGAKPFMTEIQINGITYGTGMASSKKQAKQIAAEAALQVFLPDVFNKIRDYEISREELECFDKLKIDDPKIYEISIKSGLPSPSQVLQECLKRNQGVCSSNIDFKIVPQAGEQQHLFKISCGKHSAEGFCKNKKIGKQLAYQAILMKLHPHISTWGSLLRIYCDRPSSIVKKYKTSDEDSLANIAASSSGTQRNELLLQRLKQEMRKIANEKCLPGEKLALHEIISISTLDI